MSLSCGIVGLPNAGKSTLFNALLGRQVANVASYPFTTIEPNVGVVEVPDERLEVLADLVAPSKPGTLTQGPTTAFGGGPPEPARFALRSKAGGRSLSQDSSVAVKIIPAAIKFIDIAGLVKDAHKGAGLGNKFLAKIREVDAILHVVRAFKDPNISHPQGKINPSKDIEIVDLELELGGIRKTTLYILNVSEEQLIHGPKITLKVNYLPICAKLEAELSELSPEEQKEYLRQLGKKSALDQVIRSCYNLLGLITFFTIKGGRIIQAWPIKKGSNILEAAGKVHSDFAEKFIKAEVLNFENLAKAGSWQGAKEKGLLRVEGKEYEVGDGDVIEFKI